MCGIVGTVAKSSVNQDIYDALILLQHRGQDAAGIMTCDKTRIFLRKANGLVRDAIRAEHMLRLQGNMGIGHLRYPTAGSDSAAEAQPLYVNSPYGLAIVHNGNLINSSALAKDLMFGDRRHLNTDSDSEVLLNVFAHELQNLGKAELTPQHIFKAAQGVYQRCQGAYAAIVLIAGYGIVGFRDPFGIRPLVYGVREGNGGREYMLASENVALDALGYELVRDVLPGEVIFINTEGQIFQEICAPKVQHSPCLFEYVYLARPDSILDEILVYKFRLALGQKLAEKIRREFPEHDIDVVIPVPDTSRSAALSLAQTLGLKYREGFVKNRYIGRTFIMPGQTIRQKSVRQKLNAISLEFQGKNVLLVDDSIVRGTTSKEIIQMARDAGARKVYFASAAPEVRYPNVYGIDMPAAKELIAHGRDVKEVAQIIGADRLIYQDLSALYEAAKEGNPGILRFEDSVFTGDYVTGDVTPEYLATLEKRRGEKMKQHEAQALSSAQIVEVHNAG
ncbi:MAG TPA: amidophosphoribosyltransferase [Gammaproteobacteria bacterium]|nr:amidophosphoribosyltransferase [Gammaproteobacteria bacterium]